MSSIFEGTEVKRYALRFKNEPHGVWEYPSDLEFKTLKEARAALEKITVSGGYELVEKSPCLRYEAVSGAAGETGKFLAKLLEEMGFKRFMLQRQDKSGGWEPCLSLQFDTMEEAERASGGTFRVAAAHCDVRYEPVGKEV